MEDDGILELYWARDGRAVEETRAKYGAFLRSVAMNLLNAEEDAEECVSDTYLAAWNRIPPERPAVLRAFLGRIVRNISLDRLKHLRALKRGGGEADAIFDELAEILPDARTPETEVEKKELLRELESFLQTQPERTRGIFLRRYWYADSVKAVARRFGLGENAVSAQLARTRSKLRAYLTERGYFI